MIKRKWLLWIALAFLLYCFIQERRKYSQLETWYDKLCRYGGGGTEACDLLYQTARLDTSRTEAAFFGVFKWMMHPNRLWDYVPLSVVVIGFSHFYRRRKHRTTQLELDDWFD